MISLLAVFLLGTAAAEPLPQPWDYADAMRKVAARGQGDPGVVIHVGDSITHSNPYGQWARTGKGKTEDDNAALSWMHAGADDPGDGWWLARADLPGGRSHTAAGGLRADELLAGGKNGLPSLETLIRTYRPQALVLMVGTNDAAPGRPAAEFRKDFARCVDLALGQNVVPIVSTIPPVFSRPELSRAYNDAIREVARLRSLPLIDFEKEIFRRRPDDWNGTLLNKDDVHPSAEHAGVSADFAPTAENLRESGYLLRGWLSVRKIAEVKRKVFDAPAAKSTLPPKPRGESVRLPVTRDNWFSGVGTEADGNNGGSNKLKLKSYQEMSLVDFDPSSLRGRVVLGATLHLRLAAEPVLRRVTVGSFRGEWTEGTGTGYQPQPGSSTYRHARHPDVAWTPDGGDLCRVMLGQGGTVWKMADASPPDADRWQEVPVDPAVVAARVAGVSQGFLVFDDTGTEWTRDGERFTMNPMPNRFVFSREAGRGSAPYFTLVLGEKDIQPPPAPAEIEAAVEGLPAGEADLSWRTPRDDGPAGTAGFFVTLDGRTIPQSLVPAAGAAGDLVRMRLRDSKLRPGQEVAIGVRAVDGAGNLGPASGRRVRVSDKVPAPLPAAVIREPARPGPLPRVGGVEVAVIDELDKVQPVTGAMVPPRAPGYLSSNHLWDAGARQIRLQGGRNEFVAFQVLLKGGDGGALKPGLTFTGPRSAKLRAEFGRYRAVTTKAGPLPDPIVPIGGAEDDGREPAGVRSRSLHAEIFIPHDVPAGDHDGTLTLSAGGQSLTLAVRLRVWDFTLPDRLSFLPEMNCYGLPENERAYYRLAHRHRTVLNRVPYSQRGEVEPGCAPGWDGRALDWSAWDRRFGPYLDGKAFADLPRRGVPIECFYLPLNENWPTPIGPNYNGDYWADRAFTPRYRRDFVEVSRQIAAHANERKWDETLFHGFLNGKVDFKRNGWSRGSSPWLLDEPANFQDFWALRYFAAAFHEGVKAAGAGPGRAKPVFRADVSRPEWQRDALDGLLDYNVVGGAMRPHHRIVFDRKRAEGQLVVEYGSANPVEESNTQAVGWSLDAWSLGTDGVLPWQTVGRGESWSEADTLSLFYPGRNGPDPVPSVRLKAFRRGQQDVEYLTLFALATNEPRWAVGERVRAELGLSAKRGASGTAGGAEDVGLLRYRRLLPEDAWALRSRIGRALSDLRPPAKTRLVDLRTPPRDPSRLAPREVGK